MALSREEREQFLAEPHIGALSVVERPDRAPLTVPIWYQYEPGGDLWIATEPGARKMQAIRAAGRFGIMVERSTPTARYVSVQGPVVVIEPGSPERSREMAQRYIPPARVEEYLEFERTQIGEQVIVHMRPEHWLSSDLGPAW
ncbi:pyridoxamine 5'-phosphate oxidase family protein [Paractinoplanes globisporus]|uniref:Pyridoxamine 5'-phosphate oxidase family protein n=1 Tax=Paractinoplanes globisporus TaxID=113565 RepID=A0ABW6WTY4_9ACTN|nr:pyridoxamine 5'-phosphate oxidase family protein [Actinoplanes globisporus]